MAIDVETLNEKLLAQFSLVAPFNCFQPNKLFGDCFSTDDDLVYGDFWTWSRQPSGQEIPVVVPATRAFKFFKNAFGHNAHRDYFILTSGENPNCFVIENAFLTDTNTLMFAFKQTNCSSNRDYSICNFFNNGHLIDVRIRDRGDTHKDVLQQVVIQQSDSENDWLYYGAEKQSLFDDKWHTVIISLYNENNSLKLKLWIDKAPISFTPETPTTTLELQPWALLHNYYKVTMGARRKETQFGSACWFKRLRLYAEVFDEDLVNFWSSANEIIIKQDGTMLSRAFGETIAANQPINVDDRDQESKESCIRLNEIVETGETEETDQIIIEQTKTKIKYIGEY